MFRTFAFAATMVAVLPASAATLNQTIHFPATSADALFELYATSAGHTAVTGVPATFTNAAGADSGRAVAGGELKAFCFEPEMCALQAQILDIDSLPGQHTIVMSWWNFGWAAAIDPADMTVEGKGAADSTVVLTFRDTLRGAQIELVQVNVPDYKVRILNPDATEETGPLSSIVNTHWNLLYWDGFRRETAR